MKSSLENSLADRNLAGEKNIFIFLVLWILSLDCGGNKGKG